MQITHKIDDFLYTIFPSVKYDWTWEREWRMTEDFNFSNRY